MNSDDLETDVAAHRMDLGRHTMEEIDHHGLENGSRESLDQQQEGQRKTGGKADSRILQFGHPLLFLIQSEESVKRAGAIGDSSFRHHLEASVGSRHRAHD